MSAAQQSGAQAATTATREPMTDEQIERILAAADMPSATALEPKNIAEAKDWAQIAAESKMYGVASWADAFMRITTGRELGLTAATSLRCLFVMDTKNGKRIGMDAALKHALCLRSKSCEYFRCESSDDKQATFVCKRVDHPEKRLQFTIQDAEAAGLAKKEGPWQQWRQRMLEARCKSALALLEFPDILAGLEDLDELRAEAEEQSRGGRPAVKLPAAVAAPAAVVTPSTGAPTGKPTPKTDEQQKAALGQLRADLLRAGNSDEINEIVSRYKGQFSGEHKDAATKIKSEATARVEAAAKAAAEAANGPASKAPSAEAAA